MILNKGKNNVETTLKGEAFKLEGNVTLYSILSDKLYQHKVRAVIRELSTNAVDSHIKAGTTDKAIKVNLPTHLEPQFSIRDYGTGLSPEDIDVLYSYGSSTKRDSNLFNGALGIGSKSPFAYAQSFSVNSYYNGEKYMYTIFSDNGVPTVVSLGSEKTDEPNGLEITVPVQEEDIAEFEKEAKFVYKFLGYHVDINIEGMSTLDDMTPIFSGESWGYYKDMQDSYIVMSGVAYPTSGLFDRYSDENVFNQRGIVYFVDNGQIEFSASREQIENTPHNKEVLKELEEKILKDVEQSVLNKLNSLGSVAKFVEALGDIPKSLSVGIINGINKYIGYDVVNPPRAYSYNISVDVDKLGVDVFRPERTYGSSRKYIVRKLSDSYSHSVHISRIYSTKQVLIIEDVKNRRSVIKESDLSNFANYIFVSSKEIQNLPATQRKKEYQKWIKKYKIEAKEIKFASDYPAPTKNYTATTKKSVPEVVTARTFRLGYDGTYIQKDITVEELKSINDAIIVPVVRKYGGIVVDDTTKFDGTLDTMFSSYSVFKAAIQSLSYKHKKDIVLVSVTERQKKALNDVWDMDLKKLFKKLPFKAIANIDSSALVILLIRYIISKEDLFLHQYDMDKVIKHPLFKLFPSDIKKAIRELRAAAKNTLISLTTVSWLDYRELNGLYSGMDRIEYNFSAELKTKYRGIRRTAYADMQQVVTLMVAVDRLPKTTESKIKEAFINQ